ncbi:rhamnulokinase [Spiroplasma endosymbiont of Aspidapion aeneum]|uniref:rhamnulokinase n=1 Tax=Spiroplasma endosymbiont of Aspidapion aeneum TaxID=3066276 RepID=UPI00313D3629
MEKYVCIDIGASSIKVGLSYIQNNKIIFEKIHMATNKIYKKENKIVWDIDMLFDEILIALKKIKSMRINKCNLSIDTWGVDYVLIDKSGNIIDSVYSYRDKRTNNFFKKQKTFNFEDVYLKTGVYPLEFNTMFQLYQHKIWEFKELDKILFIPDYFIYMLTGKKIADVSNLSTSQLYDISTGNIREDFLEILKIKKEHFGDIVQPGTKIGKTLKKLETKYDIPECTIWSVASHDTASAFLAASTDNNNDVLISSGTWSLLGLIVDKPIIYRDALREGFTNLVGFNKSILFLKNITGMWILQETERNLSHKFSIVDFINEAIKYERFNYLMNCEDDRYTVPENMIYEIWKYFNETHQSVPYNIGELIRCIIDSLALCYSKNIFNLEKIANKKINNIHIFGGGCRNKILNQTLADICKKNVIAGLVDATMIGNIIVQMLGNKEIDNENAAKKIIRDSFQFEIYKPDNINYQSVINKFNMIIEMGKK